MRYNDNNLERQNKPRTFFSFSAAHKMYHVVCKLYIV